MHSRTDALAGTATGAGQRYNPSPLGGGRGPERRQPLWRRGAEWFHRMTERRGPLTPHRVLVELQAISAPKRKDGSIDSRAARAVTVATSQGGRQPVSVTLHGTRRAR